MRLPEAVSAGVSVVIPVYNEASNITSVLERVLKVLPQTQQSFEVLVVDDGSTDGTIEKASLLPVQVIQHFRNKGYGAALKTGIKAARYEYVLFCDGDGQHPIEQIPLFVEKLQTADGVIGQRKALNTHSVFRFVGKLFLRTMVLLFLGIKIGDLNCGLRGFRKSVIKQYLHLLPDGFSASMTSTLVMLFRNYRLECVPIAVTNPVSASKLKMLRDGFRALNQILRMSMIFVPWRIFGSAGVALIVGGSAYGVWVYFLNHGFPPSAVMLIMTGISSIFFGLLMDQIALIRKERFEDL